MGVSGEDLFSSQISQKRELNLAASRKKRNTGPDCPKAPNQILCNSQHQHGGDQSNLNNRLEKRTITPGACHYVKPARSVVFASSAALLNRLPPQIAPVRLEQVECVIALPVKSAPCPRMNSKAAIPFSYPFSSFPPLNAIKKIAHTPAARTKSTTKVCILKTSFPLSAWPHGRPNLSVQTAMINQRLFHISLTMKSSRDVRPRSCGFPR